MIQILRDIFLHPRADVSPLKSHVRDLTKSYKQQHETFFLDSVTVLYDYGDEEQKLLHDVKYYQKKEGVSRVSSNILSLSKDDFDRIVYPPVSFLTWVKNGGNHVRALYGKWNLFKKTKKITLFAPTKSHQARLSGTQRKQHKKDRFTLSFISKKDIIGKRVLLLDDVISTGTTANEIARICKNAGASSVSGVFLFSTHS